MKVPVDRRRTILIFIIMDLLFAVGLFLSCMTLFLFQKWGVIQILVQVRAFKEAYYHYNDVVYIDKEQSEKKRTLVFYTNKGHVRYLAFDRNGEIYQAMLKKCNNLLSKEEFKKRYPNVKM